MLTIHRGDDKSFGVQFPDGTDLTGCTVFFTVKNEADVEATNPTDSNAVIKAEESAHSHISADPLNGRTVITLSAAVTGAADPGDYVYDIQLKDSAGKVRTYGKKPRPCRVLADVTQRTA